MSVQICGGAGISVEFDPTRGGKITSLRAAGIEWLVQGDGRPVSPAGTAFVDAEMSGWDECAPSIVACEVDAFSIPDHGDLWDAAFEMHGMVARATGRSYPYTFERQITATSCGVRLSYAAWATDLARPFLWAAHPQFAAPPGTRVLIEGATSIMDVFATPIVRAEWNESTSSIDSVEMGSCRKFYVAPDEMVTRAQIQRPDAVLTLQWAETCPLLGVWFDNGAFSREPVIALEPSTGYFDSLETAVRHGLVSRLAADEPLRWWIDISASRERLDDCAG